MLVLGLGLGLKAKFCGLGLGLATGWPWPWPWPWDCGLGLRNLALAKKFKAKILADYNVRHELPSTPVNYISRSTYLTYLPCQHWLFYSFLRIMSVMRDVIKLC